METKREPVIAVLPDGFEVTPSTPKEVISQHLADNAKGKLNSGLFKLNIRTGWDFADKKCQVCGTTKTISGAGKAMKLACPNGCEAEPTF